MSENKYTATPSGHVLTLGELTKAAVKGNVVTVWSLPTRIDADGVVYRVVLDGDAAAAVEGVKFNTGDALCLREGDHPEMQRMLTGSVADVGERVEFKARLYAVGADNQRNYAADFSFIDVF